MKTQIKKNKFQYHRYGQIAVNRYHLSIIDFFQLFLSNLILVASFLTSLIPIETLLAQNTSLPNSNLPPKVPTLADREQQQKNQIEQQNRQHMLHFGHHPPPKQQEMAWNYYDKQFTQQQRKAQELYTLINEANTSSTRTTSIETPDPLFHIADSNSSNYKIYINHYEKAYNELSSILSGSIPLNLKRAVFVVENAHYQNKLSYENYCRQINELVFVCKQILKEKGLKQDNYMACHYAIQKLFSQQFTYKSTTGKLTAFEPFGYDFKDYMGRENHSNMFVTKLLNKKRGQCHSLPLLYLILAEELNSNAYLGLAPNHSYIKFGNQYQSYNFETTNGAFVSDEWIVASGYISATAIKNQIYLAPLTKEKVIAECLADLSDGLEFYVGKSNFTMKCAETALIYFPQSIRSLLTINNYIVAKCAQTAKRYKFPKETDYYKYPDLKKQFDALVEFELYIEQTGYMKIPPEQYEQWQQTANEEKQRQQHLNLLDKLQHSANEN